LAYSYALNITKGVPAKLIKLNLHEAKNAMIMPDINALIALAIIPIQLEVNPKVFQLIQMIIPLT